MAQREVVTLNETTPQLEVPQTGDSYSLPRDVAVTGNISVTGTVDGRNVAADGALAASSVQPGDNVSGLTNDSGYLTSTTLPVVISIAFGDETTAIAAGAAKATFHMPFAMTLTDVIVGVTTAPVGSTATFDLNDDGTSVFATVISIDAGEKTSATAATPFVFAGSPIPSSVSIAANSLMTVDIDQIGASTAGAGPKIYLIGTRTS